MKLLIVEKLEKDVLDWLASRYSTRFAPELAADTRGLRLALHDVEAVVLPANIKVDSAWLLQAPVLKVLGRMSDSIDAQERMACEQAGVLSVGCSLSGSRAQAEFMLSCMLSLLRNVPAASVDGHWMGRELGGSTVGLLGLTRASKPLAQWLASMGAKVVGWDPELPAEDVVWSRWGITHLTQQSLLQQADALCLQWSTGQGECLNEHLMRFCKRHQVWVSTSPLSVLPLPALTRSLSSGMLAAAWFDGSSVVNAIADTDAKALAALPQVQLTNQLAVRTLDAWQRAGWEVARRLDQLLMPQVAGSSTAAQALQLVA
jgi:D-3-phosphoglycerate dehydrogenase / 2-oxoglutarate reductase